MRVRVQHVLDASLRAALRNVGRWFATLSAQAPVRAALGDVRLCAAPPVVDHRKFQDLSANKKVPVCRCLTLDPLRRIFRRGERQVARVRPASLLRGSPLPTYGAVCRPELSSGRTISTPTDST